MALTTNNFINVWSLAAASLVGIEIPQMPVNVEIGTYGHRSVGFPSVTISANAHGAAYMTAVNGSTGRANAEILSTQQLVQDAAPTHRAGLLIRGSGTAGAENGYVAYFKEESHPSKGFSSDGVSNQFVSFFPTATMDFGLGSFTIERWITLNAAGFPRGFAPFNKQGSTWNTDAGWGMGSDFLGDNFFAWACDGTNFAGGSTSISDVGIRPLTDLVGQRVHVAFVFDRTAGRVKCYINGTKATSELDISSVTGSLDNGEYMYDGYSVGWNTDGVTHETRLWAGARTDTEIVENMHKRLVGNETNLRMLQRYEENTATTAYDDTANGNDGLLNNGAAWVNDEDKILLTVAKLVAGTLTELATAPVAAPLVNPRDTFIRFRVNGSAIKATAFAYNVAEPDWLIQITDTSITADGYVGPYSRCLVANNAGFRVPGFVSVAINGETAPRPRSDIEIHTYMNDPSNKRIGIAEIGVLGQLDNGTANPSFVLVSTAPFSTKGSDSPPNEAYDDIMIEGPVFTSKAPDNLIGRSSQSYADVILDNSEGTRDHWSAWNWDGRSFDYFLGGEGWRKWDFLRVMTATTAEVFVPKLGQLGLKVRDRSALLNRKLQDSVIGGATANAGAPQPDVFGKVFNIEPVLKDAATYRYKFSSKSLAGATGITEVRDSAGSVAYTADLANGEFTLNATPTGSGRITLDVTNDLTEGSALKAGYTHGHALQTILEDRAGFGPSSSYLGERAGSLALFGGNPNANIGLYIREETNVLDLMDMVAGSGGGFWYLNELGLLCAVTIRIPTAPYDYSLIGTDIDDLKIDKFFLPSVAEQLGYQKNWSPQTEGYIGSVSAADRALYAAPAQYTFINPSYSGLDQPANHELRRRPRNRDTLLVQKTEAEAEVTRNDLIFRKLCVQASFTTDIDVLKYQLGQSVLVTYPREHFHLGLPGLITGMSNKNFVKNTVTLTALFQIQGQFPITTAGRPIVTVEDFY